MLSKVVNFVKTGTCVVIPAPGRKTLVDELHECHPSIVQMKTLVAVLRGGQDLMWHGARGARGGAWGGGGG